MKLLIRDLVAISENNTINGVGGNSKIGKLKSQANFQDKLAKSKLLVEPSSRVGFLILRARLVFAKLRQIFINASIHHYFDPKCCI